MKNVVGLFGTCGSSKWREETVIPILEAAGVEYFNPVVPEWNEEAQRNEVDHAANDNVILMAITGETSGIASMAELGWQAAAAESKGRGMVIFLEDMPNDLKDETGASLRINKCRALIRKYIAAHNSPKIVLASSLEDAANQAVLMMELMGGIRSSLNNILTALTEGDQTCV